MLSVSFIFCRSSGLPFFLLEELSFGSLLLDWDLEREEVLS
jgi:hypothetical protein